jgi:hypothetical protein
MSDKLVEVTKELGQNYREAKAADKKKDASREEFFELINERENDEPTETIGVTAASEAEARAQALKYFPAHEVLMVRDNEDGTFLLEIRIADLYRPFTFVNPEDGMVYARQQRAGSLHLDEERLREENPDLYERVTYVPDERVLRDLDEIDDEDTAVLGEYLYSDKPTMRLAPPRKAKPEELGE